MDHDETDFHPGGGGVGEAVEVPVGNVGDVDDRALVVDGVGLGFGELNLRRADKYSEGDEQGSGQVSTGRCARDELPQARPGLLEALLSGVGSFEGHEAPLVPHEESEDEEGAHCYDREDRLVVDEPR